MRPFLRFGLVLLVMSLPLTVRGQDGLGLDLTGEDKKEEAEIAAPAALPPPALEPAKAPAEPPKLTEAEIAAEDRVKSVQRKPFLKRGRFDLTPLAFLTLNDAFFPKFGPGVRATYHLQESLAVGLRFQQYNLIPDNNVRIAKRELRSRLPYVLPKSSFSFDVLWSPIYGKVSLFNSIRHFDLYVVGGAGAFQTQTSDVDGLHLSTHVGVGQRFSISDWMMVELSLLDTLYNDRPGGGTKSIIQHALSLNGGLSFFLPMGFDYREP